METLISILLLMHIVAGISSFGSGILAIVTKKGGRIHRAAGVVYLAGMTVVALTAVGISLYRNNLFLLLIAGFSFYMLWAGVRSIYNKSLRPNIWDWLMFVVGVVTAVVMLLTGHIILLVFGGLFSVGLLQELILFIRVTRGKQLAANQWLLRHIGMILGSYIATTTAFLVTNVQTFEPAWIPWLAPTIIGSPIIAYYSSKVARAGKRTERTSNT